MDLGQATTTRYLFGDENNYPIELSSAFTGFKQVKSAKNNTNQNTKTLKQKLLGTGTHCARLFAPRFLAFRHATFESSRDPTGISARMAGA